MEKGDLIEFGSYDWYVLDVQSDKALLLSQKIIEKRMYNDNEKEEITWKNCTLRKYLNKEFYESFNVSDKEQILEVTIENSGNSQCNVGGCGETKDRIFTLSIEEVKSYLEGYKFRKAFDTTGSANMWWLRSPGRDKLHAAIFRGYADGDLAYHGNKVNRKEGGVRPALWIKIPTIIETGKVKQ